MKKLAIIGGIFILIFSIFCVMETNAQNRKSVSAAEVNGTFHADNGSEFKILALGKGRLRVAFFGIYEYARGSATMANTGEAAGTARIQGDTARLTPEDFKQCTITIKFLVGNKIDVKQKGGSGDCGFGNGVSAAGMYKKVSSAKPKF